MASAQRRPRLRKASSSICESDGDDSFMRSSAGINTPAAWMSSKTDDSHTTPISGRKIIRGRRTLTLPAKESIKENLTVGDSILSNTSGFSSLADNNTLGVEVSSFSNGKHFRSSKKKSVSPLIKKDINALSAHSVSIKKKSKVKSVPNYAAIHAKNIDKIENIVEYSERKAARAKALLSGSKVGIGIKHESGATKKQLIFNNVSTTESKNDTPVKLSGIARKSDRIDTPINMRVSKKMKKSVAFAACTPPNDFETPENKTEIKIHKATPYANFDSPDYSSPMKIRKRWSKPAISPEKLIKGTPRKVSIKSTPVIISEDEDDDLDSTYDVPTPLPVVFKKELRSRQSSLHTPKKMMVTSSPIVGETSLSEDEVFLKTPVGSTKKSFAKDWKVLASPDKVMNAVTKSSPNKAMKSLMKAIQLPNNPIISPTKAIASPTKTISPTKAMKSPTETITSPTKSMKSSGKAMKSPGKVMKTPTKIMKSPTKVTKTLTKVVKTSPKVLKTLTKVQKSPTKVQKSPTKVQKSPTKVQKSPTKVQKSPTKVQKTPTKVRKSPTKVTKSPTKVHKTQNKVPKSPTKVQKTPTKATETLPTGERMKKTPTKAATSTLFKASNKSPSKASKTTQTKTSNSSAIETSKSLPIIAVQNSPNIVMKKSPSKKSPNKLAKPSSKRRPTFKTSPLKRLPKYKQKAIIKKPVIKPVGGNQSIPSTSGVTMNISNANISKSNAKGNLSSKELREKQVKAIMNKITVKAQDSRKERRDTIKGVRSNRRFDLLMKMRNPFQF